MLHALKISIAIVFSCIATLSFTQNSYYKFIENKGQHPDKVLFTADLENGTIFFEKDRFKQKGEKNYHYTIQYQKL